MKKRLILLILAMAMMLAILAGCTTDKKENGSETESTGSSDVTDGGSQGNVSDTLEAYNFGGKDFIILIREDTAYEYAANLGLGGDSVERAVYKRNHEVAQRFNATIETVKKPGGWDQRAEFLTAVRGEAMGGGGGYDLVSTHSVYLGWMTVEGLAMDMATLPGMDFSKAWWNQNLYDELNINGHVYLMLGDICTTTYEYMQVMFVNETKFNNYFSEDGIDKVYDLVENEEWTWEKCIEYATAYGTQENTETTEYGLAMNNHSWRASFISQDAYLFTRDENGDLMMELNPTSKLVSIVETMVGLYQRENIYLHVEWSTGAATINPMFSAGNVLFYPQTLGEAANIAKTMKDQYGVIPLPMYDTFQDQYYTICRDTVSAVMIITTTDDPTMSGVMTEALCMYGHELVVPEYYEIVLKVRYFDDPKYAEILDTIREGLTIQPVDMYIEGAEDCDMFWEQVVNGRADVVSRYTQFSRSTQILLDNFYASLKEQGLY